MPQGQSEHDPSAYATERLVSGNSKGVQVGVQVDGNQLSADASPTSADGPLDGKFSKGATSNATIMIKTKDPASGDETHSPLLVKVQPYGFDKP